MIKFLANGSPYYSNSSGTGSISGTTNDDYLNKVKGNQTNLISNVTDLYNQAKTDLTNDLTSQWGQNRAKAINEEAALGRLSSPASILNLNNVDMSGQKALASGLANLASNQIGTLSNATNNYNNLLQSELQNVRSTNTANTANDIARQNADTSLYGTAGNLGLDYAKLGEMQREFGLNQDQAQKELELQKYLGELGISSQKEASNAYANAMAPSAIQSATGLMGGIGGLLGGLGSVNWKNLF